MDDDKNRRLSLDEFKKGVEEYGLNFSKSEIEELFRLMDADKSGHIDYEEFLRKLRVCFTRRIQFLHCFFYSSLQ
jgi:Ca2+-binding EF-hand superfamily protein